MQGSGDRMDGLGRRAAIFFSFFIFSSLFFLSVPKLVSVHFCACCAWIKTLKEVEGGREGKTPKQNKHCPPCPEEAGTEVGRIQ